MTYRITPLRLGTIIRKKSNMIYQCGSDIQEEFPLIAFLLMGDGRNILVDTGGSEPDQKKWMPYKRSADQNLDRQLKAHGVQPEEIDTVIFTHLHWDHAGNNQLMPNARFYVQRKEYEPVFREDLPGFERDLVLKTRYELLDGDTEGICPGISVLLTPGHSPGSQTILAETEHGIVALAGDLIPTYENIERKLPNGGNYDVQVITESMYRILDLGYPILPGHEEGLFQKNVKERKDNT